MILQNGEGGISFLLINTLLTTCDIVIATLALYIYIFNESLTYCAVTCILAFGNNLPKYLYNVYSRPLKI